MRVKDTSVAQLALLRHGTRHSERGSLIGCYRRGGWGCGFGRGGGKRKRGVVMNWSRRGDEEKKRQRGWERGGDW